MLMQVVVLVDFGGEDYSALIPAFLRSSTSTIPRLTAAR